MNGSSYRAVTTAFAVTEVIPLQSEATKMLVLAPAMQVPPADPSIPRLFSVSLEAETHFEPSTLAEEVTALYDDLRGSVLRYLLSFGLSAHDGEEVIQEVFLSLFLH